MFGFFNIHKPPGPTSFDLIRQLRRRVGRKIKLGHAGTLDPFAEGVLVICVGRATRLAEYVQDRPKCYQAQITLGATSTTDDPEGTITPTVGASAPPEQAVREALNRFVGTIQQVPPAYSAVHVPGGRAYELARAGRKIELRPKTVTVYRIELLRYDYPSLELEVTCGRGTYIRSLARDLGQALGTGAYCSRLVRTAVGPFELDRAVTVAQLRPERDLVEPLMAVAHLPRLTATAGQVAELKLGRAIPGEAPAGEGEVAVVDPSGRLLAIAVADERPGRVRPVKVFCGG